jgi:hypothetical protein
MDGCSIYCNFTETFIIADVPYMMNLENFAFLGECANRGCQLWDSKRGRNTWQCRVQGYLVIHFDSINTTGYGQFWLDVWREKR